MSLAGSAAAQSRRQKPTTAPKTTPPPVASKEATEARTNLIAATKNYKSSLETVIELEKKNEARAEDSVSKKKLAMEAGVTARGMAGSAGPR